MQFNDWLDRAIEKDQPVLIKTVTGTQTRGRIKWYDNYDICIENTSREVVFLKSSLVSLSPVEG